MISLFEKIKFKIKYYFPHKEYNQHFNENYRKAFRFLLEHPQPPLTEEEKREIDSYWGEIGIKWPDYSWHQMFYGVTGIHDPKFIPDPIVCFAIAPFYNDSNYVNGWDDKNMYERFLPDILQAETLCHRFRGIFYDENWNSYGQNDMGALASHIIERMQGDRSLVLKYSKNSGAGMGVKFKTINDKDDIITIFKKEDQLDYIVQRLIRQHAWMEQFNKSSVNIFRINTWKHGGKVTILSTSVRYGIEGSFTDVAYLKGVEVVNVAGVDSDGRLNGHFANINGMTERPPQVIEDIVPNYEELIAFVIRAHLYLQPFDYIGWDITLNQDCQPLFIEYNLRWPGSILYQFVQGPLAGILTDLFLSFLKDINNRNKYIPKRYLL